MRDDNKSTQTSIVDLLGLARVQIDRQDFQGARQLINRALEIDPSHSEARQLLDKLGKETTQIDDRDGEQNESWDAALKAVEAGKVSTAFEIVHKMYPDRDREISAPQRSRLREPADEQPSSFLLQSIEDYLSSGLIEEALEIVNAALLEFRDAPQLSKFKEQVEKLVERKRQIAVPVAQAKTHRSRGKYEEAIKIIESASRLDPENLEIRDELIDVLLLRATEVSREDWKTAEKHLQRVLTLAEENREAKALYRLVLKNKKKDVIDRCLAKAEELKSSGQLEQAEQALREGLRQYSDEGSLSAKLLELRKSIEAQAQRNLVIRTKARVQQFLDQGRFREGETMALEALKDLPDSSELLQLLESVKAAQAQSEVDEAVNHALEQLRQLQKSGDLPSLRRAIAIAEDALVRHPGDHRLTPLKARLEKALTETERALKILEARAKEEASQSHFKPALDAINQALLLKPGSTDLQALKQELTQQRRAFAWAKHKNAVVICAAALGLIVIPLVVFLLRWNRGPSVLEVVVLSEPVGATVYIDNEEMGRTPLETRLKATNDGSHQIRIQMENYQDYQGLHNLRVGQKNSIGPISLVPRGISPEEALYDKAVRAKRDGRLLPPESDNALDLLNTLLLMESTEAKKFTERALTLRQEVKSELLVQLSNLRPFELRTEKELELLEKVTLVDPEDNEIRKRIDSFPGIVERLKKQIEEAIASRKLLTIDSGSALELLKRLNRSSPTRERKYSLAKMKEVETQVLELALEKCRTNDQSCSSFVEAALKDFPKNTELIRLRENSSKPKPPVNRPTGDDRFERMKELTDKADKAFQAGHYLTPEKDNAYHYGDEALKINQDGAETRQLRDRAKDLMDASLEQVLKQIDQLCSVDHVARALLTREDTERTKVDLKEARSLLGILLTLRRAKTKTQISEIDARLKDVEQLLAEFRYSVVHTHSVITSCRGTLSISGHGIEYRSDQVKDSFNKSYVELKDVSSKKGEFDLVFLDKKRDFKPATEGKDMAIKEVEEITKQIQSFVELRRRFAQAK